MGKTLIAQLQETEHSPRLKKDFKIDLRVRGVADSKNMLLAEIELDLSEAQDSLKNSTTKLNLETFAKRTQDMNEKTKDEKLSKHRNSKK